MIPKILTKIILVAKNTYEASKKNEESLLKIRKAKEELDKFKTNQP